MGEHKLGRGIPVRGVTRRLPGLPASDDVEGVPVTRLPAPGPGPVGTLAVTLGVSVFGIAGGFDGSISLDGRFVVFNSGSTNFVPDDTNGKHDVFVYSILTGQIVRASVNSSDVQGDWPANEPSISGDGRYVTFSSASTNFTTLDTYGYTHPYIRDMQTGTTTLASFNQGYVMVGLSDASDLCQWALCRL